MDDLAFGQIEPFEESWIVKNPLDFFQQGGGEDQSMASIKNLKKKCARWSGGQLICPDEDRRVESDPHRVVGR